MHVVRHVYRIQYHAAAKHIRGDSMLKIILALVTTIELQVPCIDLTQHAAHSSISGFCNECNRWWLPLLLMSCPADVCHSNMFLHRHLMQGAELQHEKDQACKGTWKFRSPQIISHLDYLCQYPTLTLTISKSSDFLLTPMHSLPHLGMLNGKKHFQKRFLLTAFSSRLPWLPSSIDTVDSFGSHRCGQVTLFSFLTIADKHNPPVENSRR